MFKNSPWVPNPGKKMVTGTRLFDFSLWVMFYTFDTTGKSLQRKGKQSPES